MINGSDMMSRDCDARDNKTVRVQGTSGANQKGPSQRRFTKATKWRRQQVHSNPQLVPTLIVVSRSWSTGSHLILGLDI